MVVEGKQLLASALSPLASFSLDTIVITVLIVSLSAFAFYAGKRSATSFLIALIGAHSMYAAFSFREQIISSLFPEQAFWVNAASFLVFFFILNVILRSMIHGDYPSGTMKFFQSIALGVASTGLILAYYYHLLHGEALVYNFSPGIDKLFTAPMALFLWIAGSVALVFFIERR